VFNQTWKNGLVIPQLGPATPNNCTATGVQRGERCRERRPAEPPPCSWRFALLAHTLNCPAHNWPNHSELSALRRGPGARQTAISQPLKGSCMHKPTTPHLPSPLPTHPSSNEWRKRQSSSKHQECTSFPLPLFNLDNQVFAGHVAAIHRQRDILIRNSSSNIFGLDAAALGRRRPNNKTQHHSSCYTAFSRLFFPGPRYPFFLISSSLATLCISRHDDFSCFSRCRRSSGGRRSCECCILQY
jgi:hypothetical protein